MKNLYFDLPIELQYKINKYCVHNELEELSHLIFETEHHNIQVSKYHHVEYWNCVEGVFVSHVINDDAVSQGYVIEKGIPSVILGKIKPFKRNKSYKDLFDQVLAQMPWKITHDFEYLQDLCSEQLLHLVDYDEKAYDQYISSRQLECVGHYISKQDYEVEGVSVSYEAYNWNQLKVTEAQWQWQLGRMKTLSVTYLD